MPLDFMADLLNSGVLLNLLNLLFGKTSCSKPEKFIKKYF